MPYAYVGKEMKWCPGLYAGLEISPSTGAFDTPVWEDASETIEHISTDRGRDGAFDQFKPGTLDVTAGNTDRRFDRRYSSGPFYNSGTGLDPRKPLRARFKWSGVEYNLATTYLDGIVQTRHVSNRKGTAFLQSTDGFKMLSRSLLPTGDISIGTGDTVAERMDRLADYVDWPAADRDFDTDSAALVHLVLQGQKALDEVYLASPPALGQVFIDRDGLWIYRGYRWLLANRITSTVTWGEDTASSERPYAGLEVDDGSDKLIFNRVTIDAFDGVDAVQTTPIDIEDATSKAAFGESGMSIGRTGIANLNVAQNAAEWVIAAYKDPQYRVEKMTVYPLVNPSVLIPIVLDAEIGDRWTVKSRPMNLGSTITEDVYVEGIAHDFDVDGHWQVDFMLSHAPSGSGYWIIGTSKLGSAGNAVWA